MCSSHLLSSPLIYYRILPIIGTPLNRGTLIVGGTQYPITKERCLFSLIINQCWKAQNLSFYSMVSDSTLLSPPAPLLGRIRHVHYQIEGILNAHGLWYRAYTKTESARPATPQSVTKWSCA